MKTSSLSDADAVLTAVGKLFDQKPPVLVEVRFPRMATSPDWYFCHEEEELEDILRRVGPGVEIHLASVWDLDLAGAKTKLAAIPAGLTPAAHQDEVDKRFDYVQPALEAFRRPDLDASNLTMQDGFLAEPCMAHE